MKNKLTKLWKSFVNPETFRYTFFGIFTLLLNIGIYQGGQRLGMNYRTANMIALIISKLAAYICNKFFVFRVYSHSFLSWLKEFLRFVLTRGATFLIDYFGVIFAVEVLHMDKMLSKYFFVIIVLVLNYILGKLVVFRKHRA